MAGTWVLTCYWAAQSVDLVYGAIITDCDDLSSTARVLIRLSSGARAESLLERHSKCLRCSN